MDRKRTSKSGKKAIRATSLPKKQPCKACKNRPNNAIVVAHSLYRKYSFVQNHYYLQQFNSITDKLSQSSSTNASEEEEQEFLSRYHKRTSRKQQFDRVREVYSMNKEIPRIFHPQIKEILAKCHHRKRLIQYFKIAKTLGIKVESVNFSSFLLSLSHAPEQKNAPFKRVLAGMSLTFQTEGPPLQQ